MIHRLANDPPCGIVGTDKKLSLCGRYVHPNIVTTRAMDVECATCKRAATSQRTLTNDRIARDLASAEADDPSMAAIAESVDPAGSWYR